MTQNDLKFQAALLEGKAINSLINIIDSSRGTNLSGEMALKIDPKFISHFKGLDPSKTIFVTGTNGKSSTTNLLAHLLRSNGFKVIYNKEGANQIGGVATTLLKESDLKGNLDYDFLLLEIDERSFPKIYEQIKPKNMLIMNIQEDQVQRNGAPEFILDKLSPIESDVRLFLNNNDARSKSFEDKVDEKVYFGVDKNSQSFKKDNSYTTVPCPVCDHPLTFDYYNVNGVGNFHCENCDFKSEAKPDYEIDNIDFDNLTFDLNGFKGEMPYPQNYMLYNYAAAAAMAKEIAGISEEDILESLKSFVNIEGRIEDLNFNGKRLKYLRMKQENPDTFQNALDVIAADKGERSVVFLLDIVDDFVPFYANTFYSYEADFKKLIESGINHFYCFSPTVCYDEAIRLKYAGIPEEQITVGEKFKPEEILEALKNDPSDTIYLITQLYNFENVKNYLDKHKGEKK